MLTPDPAGAPTLSILIPSRRPDLLAECRASLADQTAPSTQFEVLVDAAAGEFAPKVNALALAARGTYLTVLGDDDQLRPIFVEAMLEAAGRTGVDVVSSDVQEFGASHGRWTYTPSAWRTRAGFARTTPIWITSLVRRSLFHRVGGFDPAQLFADWDFWYRCRLLHATHTHVPLVLWQYRRHAGQAIDDPAFMDRARTLFYAKHPALAALALTPAI